MVCIVAGYEYDIDQLMGANPGLASRFPETLRFPNLGLDDCCRLLRSKLEKGFSTELAPEVDDPGEGAAALGLILQPLVQV